jgi:hypothetical protein
MGRIVRFASFTSIALFSIACGGFGTDVPDGGRPIVLGAGGGGAGSTAAGGGTSAGGGAGTSAVGTGGSGPAQMITKSYNFDPDGGPSGIVVTYTSAATTSMPITASTVMLSLNTTDGQPSAPSLQLNIPYSMGGQYVGVGLVPAPSADIRGKVITARVKILSGLESATDLMNSPAGAKIYVKSGAGYVYESGAPQNLTSSGIWNVITFDYKTPGYVDPTIDAAAFDPADIRELGIQIDSGGMATTAQPAVVLIDTIAY